MQYTHALGFGSMFAWCICYAFTCMFGHEHNLLACLLHIVCYNFHYYGCLSLVRSMPLAVLFLFLARAKSPPANRVARTRGTATWPILVHSLGFLLSISELVYGPAPSDCASHGCLERRHLLHRGWCPFSVPRMEAARAIWSGGRVRLIPGFQDRSRVSRSLLSEQLAVKVFGDSRCPSGLRSPRISSRE